MSKRQARTQDLTLLSAYLDHALREPERSKLETRLAQDSDLRKQLENLRRTKIMLGYLPHLKAPRNFTLTPEMVTVRKPRQPLFATLRYATAVAAILLVVLFSVEGITSLPMASMANSSAPMDEVAMFEIEATPEPLILWGTGSDSSASGMGSGGGIGGGGGTDGIVTEEITEEIAPDSEEEEEVAVAPEEPESEFVEEEPAEEILIAEPTPQTTEETAKVDRGTNNDEETDDLILGLNPEEGGQVIERSIPEEALTKEPAVRLSPLRWVEIGLAIVVVGGGITLLVLRKKIR